VFGFDDHAYTSRRQLGVEPVGNLCGEPLLDLKVAREQVDDAAELGESDDSIAR
jgi:hypothetical protein